MPLAGGPQAGGRGKQGPPIRPSGWIDGILSETAGARNPRGGGA
jgi:hypothetical protein